MHTRHTRTINSSALAHTTHLVQSFRQSFRALVAASALLLAPHARAQQSAVANLIARATVIQPLSITATHSLDFGTLVTGTTKTILPTSSAAGQFQIRGQSTATVAVTFSMPSSLSLAGSTTVQLPVSAWTYATSAGSTTASNDGTPGSAIPSGTPLNVALPTNTTGPALLALGVGATVTADPAQATGDYMGIGHITIAYADY